VLAVVVLIVAAFVLLLPNPVEESGPLLDSTSDALRGARGLYLTLGKLGYTTRRGSTPLAGPLSPDVTYVVLAPRTRITEEETAALLNAVRRGATLIFTPQGGPLTDSLGFRYVASTGMLRVIATTNVIGGPVPRIASPYPPVPLTAAVRLADSTGATRGTAFMWYQREDSTRDVDALILGRTFGRGHVIGVAPAEILSNQLFRTGVPAVALVRALEWADGDAPRPLLFDEYHHGEGTHADPFDATVHALTDTPLGRATLMALAAALVLLAAAGARPIAPLATGVIQRRSPREHVQALARAYLQSHATQLGAERLVQGLRRRHPLGMPRGVSDRVYLETIRSRFPGVAQDATLVIDTLQRSDTARLAPARDALASIEHALRTA
jgi:hypothetical protein